MEPHADRRSYWLHADGQWYQPWHSWWRSLQLARQADGRAKSKLQPSSPHTSQEFNAMILDNNRKRKRWMLIKCNVCMLFRVTWTHFQVPSEIKVACSSKCQMLCVILKLWSSSPCVMSFGLMTASSPLDTRLFVGCHDIAARSKPETNIVPAKVSVSPNYQTVMFREWTRLRGRFPTAMLVYKWHRIQIRKPRWYAITMT